MDTEQGFARECQYLCAEALNKEEKSALEKMEDSDNFKPSTSVKEKIFKKFKSFFD